MKLRVRFLQLPILFDAARLADEIAAIPEEAWRPHPKNFPGNHALPLITTDGDPLSDARVGGMRPTPHLLTCPYLMQTLDALGATWGRTRLMRLWGAAEVTPHVDTDYYWRDHMRVHVPIVTQPTVRFLCGGEEVNMGAGECWIFDTWSLHSVHNDATRARIHLVADTVGGDGLLNLMETGRSPGEQRAGWSATLAPVRDGPPPTLAYESYNAPQVMTPWELRDHLGFLLSEVAPGAANMAQIAQALNRLRVSWHALWARSSDQDAARPEYAALLARTHRQLELYATGEVRLKNGMSLGRCLDALIFNAALSSPTSAIDGEDRAGPSASNGAGAAPIAAPHAPARAPQAVGRSSGARDTEFDRPVFIISPPRSGSTLLFETLAGAPGLYTIGGESHGLMEAIPAINPATRAWDSNRLTAADADGGTAHLLRMRFRSALQDREARSPPQGAVRMLEKTPKNALRVPFLAAAFPEARFIYLYRDPRATLASMMEAWTSGRFRTYPQLPGWTGPDWSLLLVPGWRDLIGAPLDQIVARQWATTCDTMLDDLAGLDADRWRAVRYETFVVEPEREILRLTRWMELRWDRPLRAGLPLSRHTLTPPNADKWRAHAPAIEAATPIWADAHARAVAMLAAAAD